MTLREAVYKHVLKTLYECDENRTRTAKELGVSVRHIGNLIREMRDKGFEIKAGFNGPTKKRINEVTPKYELLMASNQERLKHADRMINANFL